MSRPSASVCDAVARDQRAGFPYLWDDATCFPPSFETDYIRLFHVKECIVVGIKGVDEVTIWRECNLGLSFSSDQEIQGFPSSPKFIDELKVFWIVST